MINYMCHLNLRRVINLEYLIISMKYATYWFPKKMITIAMDRFRLIIYANGKRFKFKRSKIRDVMIDHLDEKTIGLTIDEWWNFKEMRKNK